MASSFSKSENKIRQLKSTVDALTRSISDDRRLIDQLLVDLNSASILIDINRANLDTISDLKLKLREFETICYGKKSFSFFVLVDFGI